MREQQQKKNLGKFIIKENSSSLQWWRNSILKSKPHTNCERQADSYKRGGKARRV